MVQKESPQEQLVAHMEDLLEVLYTNHHLDDCSLVGHAKHHNAAEEYQYEGTDGVPTELHATSPCFAGLHPRSVEDYLFAKNLEHHLLGSHLQNGQLENIDIDMHKYNYICISILIISECQTENIENRK